MAYLFFTLILGYKRAKLDEIRLIKNLTELF